jgi:hypothetical protein
VVDQVQAAFADFRRALPREDQARFDTLFNYARRHTPGGVLLADPDPFRPVLLGMLIELFRRLDAAGLDRAGSALPDAARDPASAPGEAATAPAAPSRRGGAV